MTESWTLETATTIGGVPVVTIDLGLQAYGPMPHSLLVTLGRMIGEAPGLRVISVGMTEHDEGASLAIVLEGWGPSLHAQEIRWSAEITGSDHGTWDWAGAVADFASIAEEQRQRSLAGEHHGLLSPLPRDRDELELRHLAVDADWFHLIMGKNYAASSMEELLARENTEVVILRQQFLDRMTEVFRALLGRSHKGGPFYVGGEKGAEVCFNGLTVDVFGLDLPQSVLEELVGRKVSAVRSVHPLLDDRIILNAECEDGHLHLDLEPRTMSIATIMEGA